MTTTEKALTLDAWGGKVGPGEECWVIDANRYTIARIESAVVVEVDYDARLMHENRFYRACNVACTEQAARRRLEEYARETIAASTLDLEAARRYLASLS